MFVRPELIAGCAPFMTRGSTLRLIIRTLAGLTRSRGASRGANGVRHRATPGHVQPLSVQLDGTSGHLRHRLATARKCLLSSRSQVRILLGALIRLTIRRCGNDGVRNQGRH